MIQQFYIPLLLLCNDFVKNNFFFIFILPRCQTKIEYDRLIALIGKKPSPEPGIKVRWRGCGISLAQRRDFIQQLQSLTGEPPTLPLELNPKEFQVFHLALLNKVRKDG